MYLIKSSQIDSYLDSLGRQSRDGLEDLLRKLAENNGKLSSGFTRYLRDKIWELKLESEKRQHRLLYTVIPGFQLIILLGFAKKTRKTPPAYIEKAIKMRKLFIENL